jgi:hypothetical protein
MKLKITDDSDSKRTKSRFSGILRRNCVLNAWHSFDTELVCEEKMCRQINNVFFYNYLKLYETSIYKLETIVD